MFRLLLIGALFFSASQVGCRGAVCRDKGLGDFCSWTGQDDQAVYEKSGSFFERFFDKDECAPDSHGSVRSFCPWLDNQAFCHSAEECAEQALEELEDQTGREFSSDFEDGFEEAYRDIAQGGSGVTPPVPPEKYWSASFRTPEGHARAQDWFAGYRAGAENAHYDGLGEFNYVPTSASFRPREDYQIPGPTLPTTPTNGYLPPQMSHPNWSGGNRHQYQPELRGPNRSFQTPPDFGHTVPQPAPPAEPGKRQQEPPVPGGGWSVPQAPRQKRGR